MSALRYRVTYKDEAPTYHQNVNYVRKAIGRDQSVVSETLRGSGFYEDYFIEKLPSGFKLEQPEIGEMLMIEGTECKVTAISTRTFAVLSDKGTGLVRLTDRELVDGFRFSSKNEDVRAKKFVSR